MGRFVNPDNSAFQATLNSRIYVDKTGLIACMNWGMFKGIEPTKYIQLAYLTGILPIKKEKTQSALNNFSWIFNAQCRVSGFLWFDCSID